MRSGLAAAWAEGVDPAVGLCGASSTSLHREAIRRRGSAHNMFPVLVKDTGGPIRITITITITSRRT